MSISGLGPLGFSSGNSAQPLPQKVGANGANTFEVAQLVLFNHPEGGGCQGVITTDNKIVTATHCTDPNISFSQERAVEIPVSDVNVVLKTGDPPFPVRRVSQQEFIEQGSTFKVGSFDISPQGQPTGTSVVPLTQFRGNPGNSGAPVFDSQGNVVGAYSGVRVGENGEVSGYNFHCLAINR